LVVLLLGGNALLRELMSSRGASHLSGRVWLLVAAALVVAAAVAFSTAMGAALHRLLIERTIRYCTDIVLRVAAHVPLRDFDTPEFHDRLMRASQEGIRSALPIAMAVPQLAAAVVTGAGISGGLAVVSPWLVPITLLAGIPLWLTGRRNSAEMYTVFFGLTPNDRSRFHIEEIIRGRASAPEVRAFGLASFLLSRWSTLYDARIEEIRGTARRYIRRSALGSLLGSMVLGLVLVVLLLLLDHGVLDLGGRHRMRGCAVAGQSLPACRKQPRPGRRARPVPG
jgi:ATP-binding cassette, subfamily B, bacterial